MFMIEIPSLAGRTINGLSHGRAILGMSALDNKFHGRLRRPVTSEDSKGLV
jgi:hypothetical protein